MDDKVKQLAKQAGFIMWGSEYWNPGDVVDWSCRYDSELERFTELVVNECFLKTFSVMEKNGEEHWSDIAKELKEHFGIE